MANDLRYCIEFILRDKTRLVAITRGFSKGDAITQALRVSRKVFGGREMSSRKFRLDKTTPYTIEKWSTSGRQRNGNIPYKAVLYYPNRTESFAGTSAGVKSFYNLIESLTTRPIPVTLIYDETQVPILRSSKKEAQWLLTDSKNMDKLVDSAIRKKDINVLELGEYAGNLQILCSMVKDYSSGLYTDIPRGTILGIVGTLVYFVSPIDVIPDVIPGLGKVDDAFVIMYTLRAVQGDLDRYVRWKRAQQ